MGLGAYLLGCFDAVLPKRWRFVKNYASEQLMARCTMISGLVESVVALLVLRYWYVTVLTWILSAYAEKALSKQQGWAAYTPAEFVGGAGFMIFAGNPITWIILYFGAEGILRLAAAVITGEAFGTLPLCAIDAGIRLATRRRKTSDLPLVSDEILPGDASSDLRIASCQKRTEWKYPFTIRYERAFFQVVGVDSCEKGPRPYVYLFRRLPPGEVARGLRDYHPDDVLVTSTPIQSVN